MTNDRIREIITEETARLPANVRFDVTFHGNGAHISGEEIAKYERVVERFCDGVYSPCLYKHIATAKRLGDVNVYGIQGEKRVREIVRKLVDFAIENASPVPDIIHPVPTAKAVDYVKREFPENVVDLTAKSAERL